MFRAFVVLSAALCVALGSRIGPFTSDMLRSSLPADSPLLEITAPAPVKAYNPVTAKNLLFLSGIAYCAEEAVMNWTCGACKSTTGTKPVAYLYDETLNVAGYVAATANTAIVSFRGTVTSSIMNWIDDFNFTQTVPMGNCAGCGVHSGFYYSYLALREQMVAALNKVNSPNVLVTGHSLGAAIACIAAYDLTTTHTVTTHYTFGQPRVGNEAYATVFKSLVSGLRVVHNADIVPHVPLVAMGFHHVPTEVWYNEPSTSYKVCDGSGEDPTCSDSVALPISVSDHLDYLGFHVSSLC